MSKIGFHIVKLWCTFLSVHPFWLLYLKSDFYYFVTYHLFRYRRKVVRQNLLRSFPEKKENEIKTIEKRYYHNLCDLFVEAPKMLRMKQKGYKYRIHYANPELIDRLADKNIFYAIPHSGNWEWFGKMIPDFSDHNCLAVYKKVQNAVFERLMLFMRTHDCALEMTESNNVLRRLTQLRDQKNAVLMVADQTPFGRETDYWNEFLHQDTCWFTGLERMSRMLDYAVVFVDMRRTGRGRYEVRYELITDDPKSTEKGYIMERYARLIERSIIAQPDNWLWSHRRWKHQRPQKMEA